MEDLIAFLIISTVLCVFGYSLGGCQEEAYQSKIIQEKQFCIKSKVSGVEYKKCYEVREK
jgi:hypothetical protein